MKERGVEYYANKYRVFEIYGISRNESRKYSMHHVWFASDGPSIFYKDPISSKGNMCPLRKDTHQKLHNKVDRMKNH
jgi:hypothetical protein